MIAHTSYSVTVAICSHMSLEIIKRGKIHLYLLSTRIVECPANIWMLHHLIIQLSFCSPAGCENCLYIYQLSKFSFRLNKAVSSRLGSLLSIGRSPGKTDRLYMKGPGGHCEVEVAVSGVEDQGRQDSGPFSSLHLLQQSMLMQLLQPLQLLMKR